MVFVFISTWATSYPPPHKGITKSRLGQHHIHRQPTNQPSLLSIQAASPSDDVTASEQMSVFSGGYFISLCDRSFRCMRLWSSTHTCAISLFVSRNASVPWFSRTYHAGRPLWYVSIPTEHPVHRAGTCRCLLAALGQMLVKRLNDATQHT